MRCSFAVSALGAVLLAGLPAGLAQPAGAMPRLSVQAVGRPAATTIEFWCSPGFEPRGGRCIATLSRDELLIYETDAEAPPPRRHHHRHGLRELY